MRVAFLGATKGMGRALARLSAERGDAICLLGRNDVDLERSAADLNARGAAGPVRCFSCDLEQTDAFAPVLSAVREALGGLDAVVVTAGIFATQEELEADPVLAERLVRVNFSNTVMFCEAARKVLLEEGGGTLCVFSSVAGERGRKPVIIYGAAKAGLTRYLEGLDHKHHSDGLRVITVKPGFVKTSMTAGLSPPPFAGEPDAVARRVMSAIDRGTPVVYAPAPWRYIMAIIRALPRAIMRRIEF
jgi:short-subunit dehydrogenase